jgi:predicted HD phosphohydrolase
VGTLRFARPIRTIPGRETCPQPFVVRATVTDPAKREAFGTWYSREHLPDAMKSFGAVKAWRYWSATDPSLHHAMYQFTDKTALERATGGPEAKRLVADFNRDWPDVTRTREVLVLAEELAA